MISKIVFSQIFKPQNTRYAHLLFLQKLGFISEGSDATVLGVFNRDDGLLRLRKVYNDTGTDWWYMGVLSGGVLTGGVWMADSDGGQSGVWTGRRP